MLVHLATGLHEFFMNTLGLMASWLTGVPLVSQWGRFVLGRLPQTVFLGQGGLREELEAHAARLGIAAHLRFLGHREDVGDLLSIFDNAGRRRD